MKQVYIDIDNFNNKELYYFNSLLEINKKKERRNDFYLVNFINNSKFKGHFKKKNNNNTSDFREILYIICVS